MYVCLLLVSYDGKDLKTRSISEQVKQCKNSAQFDKNTESEGKMEGQCARRGGLGPVYIRFRIQYSILDSSKTPIKQPQSYSVRSHICVATDVSKQDT